MSHKHRVRWDNSKVILFQHGHQADSLSFSYFTSHSSLSRTSFCYPVDYFIINVDSSCENAAKVKELVHHWKPLIKYKVISLCLWTAWCIIDIFFVLITDQSYHGHWQICLNFSANLLLTLHWALRWFLRLLVWPIVSLGKRALPALYLWLLPSSLSEVGIRKCCREHYTWSSLQGTRPCCTRLVTRNKCIN